MFLNWRNQLKKKFIIIVTLFMTFMIKAGELTVVEYYNLMPGDFFKTGKYEIINKSGKYYVTSDADYELEITVDFKNKYLEINDEGTGGGTTTHEFAVFLRAGNDPVIGLSEFFFDGVGMDSYLYFFENKDSKWTDITDKLLKKPDMNDFIDVNDNDMVKLVSELKDYFAFNFTIPRYGTTMKCTLDYSKLLAYTNGDDNSSLAEKAKKFENGLKYNTIEFLWDYKKGVFNTGKKMKE